jgi:hypothetical protein
MSGALQQQPLSSNTRRILLLVAAAAAVSFAFGRNSASCRNRQTTSRYSGMSEGELHEKGLWRSPRLGADACIVRHVKSRDTWEVLLVKVHAACA